MKNLYAPWRSAYTTQVTNTKDDSVDPKDCIFCKQFNTHDDKKYFILRRFKHTVVILNLYPYNAGHILILPREHCADLHSMSQQARFELMELMAITVPLLKKTLHAQGINVGLNLGKAAGAGIPAHLHMHIIPRWVGDTNFLPVIAETKQISTDLNEIYELLLPEFQNIDKEKLEYTKELL